MKKSLLHANPSEEEVAMEEELDNEWQEEDDLLIDVNEEAMLYTDQFPTLPQFPCMSSSSSSSSMPAPVKSMATSSNSTSSASSSSAASWAVLKYSDAADFDRNNTDKFMINHRGNRNDTHHDGQVDATLSSTASMEITLPPELRIEHCTDHVMENLGYMDLLDTNDLFDPSSIFLQDDFCSYEDFQPQLLAGEETMAQRQGGGDDTEDLAMFFLEWLRSNKETVSAEDLRKVKLKKATVVCAVRRLGGGQTGMKELLKLVLEWVQTNYLPNKRKFNGEPSNPNPSHYQSNPSFVQSTMWIPPPAASYDQSPAVVVPGYPPQVVGYNMGPPFGNGSKPYPPPPLTVIESAQTWPPHQFSMVGYAPFPDNNHLQHPLPPPLQEAPGYANVNQYPYSCFQGPSDDNKLARMGLSAAKEARKKRMAWQRRCLSHRYHHHHHNNPHQQIVGPDQHQINLMAGQQNPSNWVYWPSPSSGAGASTQQPMMTLEIPPVQNSSDQSAVKSQQQHYPRQPSSDRRQGWKPEKNLRFLLQKVLKQSDVGNLGRIVLPKKEAETHLPELAARDGISIAMEDIGTSCVWNMRYRFWPNNKSRMYLLENTGDFVRTNGLQEGDFIVIYSDIKCGKYLIRGVKVRQQQGQKSEAKRGGKLQKKN